ncbi:MAG: SufD family Fe-S cluster assembly protein [Breznakia sp.]
MKKQANIKNITIDTDGFYKFTLDGVETLHIKVQERITCELILNLENIQKLQKTIVIDAHAQARILWKNKSEAAKIYARYDIAQYANIKIGYYELENKQCELSVVYHLLGIESALSSSCVSVASAKKHYDFECIHHAQHTTSDIHNYEISKEFADYRVKTTGNIKKGASFSKARQVSRILTSSDHQKSEAIPLLLIDENEVEASHANSMGKMDDDYLYYLTSRGIHLERAKDLLTLSFLMPIVDVIEHAATKEALQHEIREQVGL